MAPDQIRMFSTKIIAKAKIILINWKHFELRSIITTLRNNIITLGKSMILNHRLGNMSIDKDTPLRIWKHNNLVSK